MMSSESKRALTDPELQSKMPLFDMRMSSTGLSKPHMSDFLAKQALSSHGAYFTYDPRVKDRVGFTSPWRSSNAALLDGQSPVSHLSGTEESRAIYRQDSSPPEESHSSSMRHAPVKQGFRLYPKSSESRSPKAAASVAALKQKTVGESSSAASENPVYVAIPKPVYGTKPYCSEMSCMTQHRYGGEHPPPRMPNAIFERDWMQTGARYPERLSRQRTAQDPLLLQRGSQFESDAEPVRRMRVEKCSPSRAKTLPAVIEPHYSSYPYAPNHVLFDSLREHRQPVQTSSRGYPSLYPSPLVYERMTSEVYQERSAMSKYGQLAQHPGFYYPQANVEVDDRTQGKDSVSKPREDVPVIHKHSISNPREHYMLPQMLHNQIPLPLSNPGISPHAFMRVYEYPYYAGYNLDGSLITAPQKILHAAPAFLPSHINDSPAVQHLDHPPVISLHKDKPSTSLHGDHIHGSPPFAAVDQSSPTMRAGQLVIPPPVAEMAKHYSHRTTLNIDPKADLNNDKPLDFSSYKAPVTLTNQPKRLPISPSVRLPQMPNRRLDQIEGDGANDQKVIYSPVLAKGNQSWESVSSLRTSLYKGSLKRPMLCSSPPRKIKEEDRDVYEVKCTNKRQKLEVKTQEDGGKKTDTPPLPVIDTVFSLASPQICPQPSDRISPGREPPKISQPSERPKDKHLLKIKEKGSDQDNEQSVICQASKEINPDTPKETVEDPAELQMIKDEKVDPVGTDKSAGTRIRQNGCSEVTIKKELERNGSPDSRPKFLEKFETAVVKNETLEESKHSESVAWINSRCQSNTQSPHSQVTTPTPRTPPEGPGSKIDFKNIPPQCLKLSTYNIIIPDNRFCPPFPSLEKPCTQPVAEITSKQDFQMPVRKHFWDLHHSFCKLVSKSVSTSSEQELKLWLSKLEIFNLASTSAKDQKVSQLLGVKAREGWFTEELRSALSQILDRLMEYAIQKRCPFPHVIRTGAAFLPMLVVKEMLFPMVEGIFIDQVLQEHKIELRPTTLSEEKILIQLHKRACSSRLRRLMSIKHLPDIYTDVVNLLYYTCVCKQLESTSPDLQKTDQE
ncbi:uncharacterized protein C15orf39 homolog isoform 2-T2 [Pholidichthys leucotaenia]